jgi:hypothetical protein
MFDITSVSLFNKLFEGLVSIKSNMGSEKYLSLRLARIENFSLLFYKFIG